MQQDEWAAQLGVEDDVRLMSTGLVRQVQMGEFVMQVWQCNLIVQLGEKGEFVAIGCGSILSCHV